MASEVVNPNASQADTLEKRSRRRPLSQSPRADTGAATEGGMNKRELLKALSAFKRGDFKVRLSRGWTGIDGRIAEAFNDVIEINQRMAGELARIGRVVGRDGKI